jgi:hypothetical protein
MEKEQVFPAFPFVYMVQKRNRFTDKFEMQQQVNPGITEIRLMTTILVAGNPAFTVTQAVEKAREIIAATEPVKEESKPEPKIV